MRPVNEIADQIAASASESVPPKAGRNSNVSKLRDALVVNLWERMVHLYGHKWSSSMGDSAHRTGTLTSTADTWARGLSGVTAEQIAAGLRRCLDREDAWPPTLPEFRKLCTQRLHTDLAHRPFPPALPKPLVDPAVAQGELAKMREILG